MPEPVSAWKTSDGRVYNTKNEALRWERFGQLVDRLRQDIGLPQDFYGGEIGPFTEWLLKNWNPLRAILNDPDLNE